jgi:hypothetical protein
VPAALFGQQPIGAARVDLRLFARLTQPARLRLVTATLPAAHSAPRRAEAPPAESAEVVETHLSWLVFLGDRVVKVKKPLRTDFCDFTTLDRRRAACQREVALNRRLTADVYLGVLDILGPDGRPCEHAVLMRRLPGRLRLSRLIRDSGDVHTQVRRVAEVMAAFHARAARSAQIDRAGTADFVRGLWEENLGVLQSYAGPVLDPATLDRVRRRARQYLRGRADLFARRVADRHIVDGHGDLLAEDIFCLPDRPKILDCLEFDDTLRHGDVLADVAFLAMDLERLGATEEAAAFLDDYRMASEQDHPSSLADLYIAYRAVVRAKVACLRHDQAGQPAAAEQARRMLALADRHLAAARIRLVLVGGLPGTGKSTLAEALNGHYGWPVLRSDTIRKQLTGRLGRRADAPPGQGIYQPMWTSATYAALIDQAAEHLRHGSSVILDATWTDATHRAAAARLARRTAADLVALHCDAPDDLALRRLLHRRTASHDASDATPAAYPYLAARADQWPAATRLDTTDPLPRTLAAARQAIDSDWSGSAMAAPGPPSTG